MATLNLGRIKPVFRGAYAGGTAYVIDDIVTSGGETFICIQASTGNATSSASHWTKLAEKGTNGTDGTDLTSTLSTRGDIAFKGASALERLPKGTAGYYLKQGANDPEWSEVSAGSHTKIAEFTSSGTPTYWALDNIFTADYDFYLIYLTNYGHVASNLQSYFRFRTGGASGSNDADTRYHFMYNRIRRSSSTETDGNDGAWNSAYGKLSSDDLASDTDNHSFFKLFIHKPFTADVTSMTVNGGVNKSNLSEVSYVSGVTSYNTAKSHTGISFSAQDNSNGIRNGNKAFVYGIKY